MTSERIKTDTSRRADGVHDEHGHEHPEHHGHDHTGREHPGHHGHDHAHERQEHHEHEHPGHEHPEHELVLKRRGHGHDHGHDHDHDLSGRPRGFRASEAFAAFRPDRDRGFGAGKVLYFDAFSGVSGDMTVAALVDVGVPQSVVVEAVDRLGIAGCHLSFKQGHVGAIGALKFDVEIVTPQQERNYATIDRLLEQADLDSAVKHTARAIFRKLAEAEASVHRTSVDEVHFHEVGAVDSIADIVGAAACIEYIGATVWTSPLPLGSGFIQCRHGTIPLPAPATVQCLVGIATRDAGIEAELVTPTGAAIIGTMARHCSRWPSFVPIAVGWGAGSRILADRPNALRVVLGEPQDPNGTAEQEDHVVIEANIDDATGELVGHALGLLLEEGALDAWAVPITMKKGRPGVILSAIVRAGDETRLTALLIRETTTLGVRRHVTARTVRPRRMIDVVTRYGSIPVKVSEGPFGPPQLKPEFDSCVERSREFAVPAREVHACAIAAARAELGIDGIESSDKTR